MSDHHVRWSSFQWWTSLCWSYLLYDSRSTFRSLCSEAISTYARLVKFNPSILCVQNWLAPVVCERRAYHTRSSRGVSARRTFTTVHTQGEHLYLEFSERSYYSATAVLSKIRCIKDKHHMHSNKWYDMAIIILCLWSLSPKHCHEHHRHWLDTLISIVASLSSRQLLLLRLSLPLSDKVKQLHSDCISYNKVTTIWLLPVAANCYKTWSSHTTNYISSRLDHITSQQALQKQVRRPLLCCCKFYVVVTGF